MSFPEAFAEHEAAYRAAVTHSTWGHLRPAPQDHGIAITFTVGCYGDIAVVDATHESLPDSPWLFEAIMDHVGKKAGSVERGTLWTWTGTLRWFRNGRHRFINGRWVWMTAAPMLRRPA